MNLKRTACLSALLAVAIASMPASASAGSPARGEYTCFYNLYGKIVYPGMYIEILKGSRYRYNGSERGKFTFANKKVRFKTGPMRKRTAKYGRNASGDPAMSLVFKVTGGTVTYHCVGG